MAQVEEPLRLQAFMNARSAYSEDFKALVLKLIQQGQAIAEIASLTGVSSPTLYEWLENWNKKKKLD